MGLDPDMREWQEQVAWLVCTNGLTEATLQIFEKPVCLSEPLTSFLLGIWGKFTSFLPSVFRSCTLGFQGRFYCFSIIPLSASSSLETPIKKYI